VLSLLRSHLSGCAATVRDSRHKNPAAWIVDCIAGSQRYRIAFDPAANFISVRERRWLFNRYLWGCSVDSADAIENAVSAAVDWIIVSPKGTHRPNPRWIPSTEPITDSNYEDIFAAHTALVVHFWAPWNGADPPADKEIAIVRGRLPDVAFYACNIDENFKLSIEVGVQSIPSFVIIVNRQPNPPIAGLRSAIRLESEIRKCVSATKG